MDFSEPETIEFLNINDNFHETLYYDLPNFSVLFSLSKKVHIEKRIVYNYITMFSDVGGLHDFFALVLGAIFGFLNERLMVVQLLKMFFFQAESVRSMTPLSISKVAAFCYPCLSICSK